MEPLDFGAVTEYVDWQSIGAAVFAAGGVVTLLVLLWNIKWYLVKSLVRRLRWAVSPPPPRAKGAWRHVERARVGSRSRPVTASRAEYSIGGAATRDGKLKRII